MGYRLGVDLGTTYTACAVQRDERVEIVSLGAHDVAVPSVVFLREDGTLIVGDAAERRALTAPHRLAREFKRRIGDPTPVLLAGTPYSAHALTATLLRWVVDRVSEREGEAPEHVVVTHPANWGPYKREALQHAITLAEIPPTALCSEPEAAALRYAALNRLVADDVVAVYDLGGGTFDTAVLARTDDGFTVLGTPAGVEQLGGVDFDAALFHHLMAGLGPAVDDLDVDDEATTSALSRLRRDVVLAKEALSEDTEVVVPVVLPQLHTQVRLTRSEFEDLIEPSVADTVVALRRALRSADIAPQQLTAVLLAGGSSRIPLVAETLSARLGRPVAVDTHPKHLVALGAALVGAPARDRTPATARSGEVTSRARAGRTTATATSTGGGAPGRTPRPALPEHETPRAEVQLPEGPPPAAGTAPSVGLPARWPGRRWAAALVVAATAGLGWLAYVTVTDGGGTPGTVTRVTIDGRARWTDTGVVFRPGDTLQISASGRIGDDRRRPTQTFEPDGVSRSKTNDVHRRDPYVKIEHAALIGRVGSSGSVFFIGRALSTDLSNGPPQSGPLFLGVNDSTLTDNSGKFDVTVELTPAE